MPPLDLQARAATATESPSPLWGGARGGGNPKGNPRVVPPSLSLPHKGGGNAEAPIGKPDPNGPIWQGNAFHEDVWMSTADNIPLPDAAVILSKAQWLAQRDALAGRNASLGLRLEPGEAIDDIAADLARFALIALSFPKFSDGRAFSTARLLREKHGFAGELRAVGNVLSDQIPFMRRVGFDSHEVTHAPTRRALAEGRIADVTLHYQPTGLPEPAAGTRPWLRRSIE
jgi:uncharacterized protein (DUF934 family)